MEPLTGYPVLPYQGLQCDTVTPFQGCHHLDIAACSLVSVGIKLLCPSWLPLSSLMLFLWSFTGCYGAWFLGSRRLPDCPVPSLSCLTPSGAEDCFGKVFVGGFILGGPSDMEAALCLSFCPHRRLGPALPSSGLPLEHQVTPLLSLRPASLQQHPDLHCGPPMVNTTPLSFADE